MQTFNSDSDHRVAMRQHRLASALALSVLAVFFAVSLLPAGSAQSADNAYYDQDNNWFVLEFSTGLTGTYTSTIVDGSAAIVQTTTNLEFSGQKKIGLAPDEGVEITDGKYYISMVKGSEAIEEVVEVELKPTPSSGDSSIVLYIGGAAVAVAAVGIAAFLFLRR